jgi:hypothetical protein
MLVSGFRRVFLADGWDIVVVVSEAQTRRQPHPGWYFVPGSDGASLYLFVSTTVTPATGNSGPPKLNFVSAGNCKVTGSGP